MRYTVHTVHGNFVIEESCSLQEIASTIDKDGFILTKLLSTSGNQIQQSIALMKGGVLSIVEEH